LRIGARKPRWEPVPLHSPAFDIDERALGIGALLLDRLARAGHAHMGVFTDEI
jgi:metal-dependent amidase/aminoacylase/carboxypeptidase family protein